MSRSRKSPATDTRQWAAALISPCCMPKLPADGAGSSAGPFHQSDASNHGRGKPGFDIGSPLMASDLSDEEYWARICDLATD